ncbi:MAG: hypothetical protein IPL74_10825 [Bacteroidetes bacterium]|nr:hypothetical protein [Bacteroidota bacterium]
MNKTLIEKFQIRGNAYLWKYKDNERNFPGWNLTVDKEASERLVKLLDMMYQCEWATNKLVKVTPPKGKLISIPNNWGGTAAWESVASLKIISTKTVQLNHWRITEKLPIVEIEFGPSSLAKLKQAIAGIPHGIGDFSIGDVSDENLLTFWWNLEK